MPAEMAQLNPIRQMAAVAAVVEPEQLAQMHRPQVEATEEMELRYQSQVHQLPTREAEEELVIFREQSAWEERAAEARAENEAELAQEMALQILAQELEEPETRVPRVGQVVQAL